MMPKDYPRRIASFLLRSAISIAPHDTFEWGQAMLSELSYIKGDWLALFWAIGGAGVLAKRAFVSIFIPSHRRGNISPTENLFVKEVPMRSVTLAAVGACALVSLLFCLAPAFRQAFRISLGSWYAVNHVMTPYQRRKPELNVLVQRAERNHDAEGLAFVAVRHSDAFESARLAEEAVHLDPNLTWVYGIVAVGHAKISDRLGAKLEQWDPQNALPYFIVVEGIDIDQVLHGQVPHRIDQESRAWQAAMADAFASLRLDTYRNRLKELDRRVMLRYGLSDPSQVMGGECRYCVPSFTAWDSSRYAQSIVESGEKLEAQGDHRGASEKYLAAARFCQMLGPSGGFPMRQVTGDAYKRLQMLSEKEGHKAEGAFYASLQTQLDGAQQEENLSIKNRFRGDAVSRWNAFLVRASGLTMVFSVGLVLMSALSAIARSQSPRLSSLRPSRLTLGLSLGGAIGALLSSGMLYVSYRPYAEILHQFIRTGDDSRLPELSEFLAYAQIPLGAGYFKQLPDFVFYFWAGVTMLCVAALVLALARLLWRGPHSTLTSS